MNKTINGLQRVNKMGKEAQKIIKGGVVSGLCKLYPVGGATPIAVVIVNYGPMSSGAAASAAANADCLSLIQQYGGGCHYDCAYDGFGS
jgi:hypothetical protein